jgi:parvulin-like peptidyl-prolyl isomerase
MTLEEWVAQWQITPVEYLEGISSEYHLTSVLSGMAYRSYMTQRVNEAGIPEQPAVQASIQQTYLNALAREVESEIKKSIEFNPAELYTTFQANPDRFIQPKQVLLQRIVVSSEEKAAQVYDALEKGQDFTRMVQLYTESNADLMVDGIMNYEQWARLGHLGQELQQLEPDYITRPIAYQANEYHIYKCLDIVEARALRFDEAKEAVQDILLEQKFREARSELIDQVKIKHNAFIDLERLEEINIEI